MRYGDAVAIGCCLILAAVCFGRAGTAAPTRAELLDVVRQTDAQPHLIPFYEKRGFVVTEPDADCMQEAVKKVTWRRTVGAHPSNNLDDNG